MILFLMFLLWAANCFNQVIEVDVKTQGPGPDNIHNNAFYAEATLLQSELKAMRDCDPLAARHWIVRQPCNHL
mgnify:FL=1